MKINCPKHNMTNCVDYTVPSKATEYTAWLPPQGGACEKCFKEGVFKNKKEMVFKDIKENE